jgi:hypothetical protein
MTAITNPAELRSRGIEVLIRELGYVNAMRFLLLYDPGHGDYTMERDQFLPVWTVEEMLREAEGLLPRTPPSLPPGG